MRKGIDCKGREWEEIELSKQMIDATNKRFNNLVALFPVLSNNKKQWLCRCDCGNETVASYGYLNANKVKSCGCIHKTLYWDEYRKNNSMVGEKYGKLTVIDYLGIINGDATYHFKCDCGNELDLPMTRVKTGNTCSCGCLRRDNTIKHWQHYRENSNIVGQVFGELTVMNFVCVKDEAAIYRFKCSCGNIVDLPIARVKNGTTSSCGHLWNDWSDSTKSDIIGQRFGKLVVRSYVGVDKHGATLFECDCDCGNSTVLPRYSLVGNRTHSCGCIISVGESNIKKLLTDANILYKPQQGFADLKSDVGGSLLYDFGILNSDGHVERLVEFDGEQHYKPVKYFGGDDRFEAQQCRDNLKNQYALSHNIPLVRIPYSKRDSMTLDDILGDKYLIAEEV